MNVKLNRGLNTIICSALCLGCLALATSCQDDSVAEINDYAIVPIPFTDVTIDDSFWLPRIETNRNVTIPYAIQMCEETGRIDNLRKAAGLMEGQYEGRRFNDSDVFKAMEGIAYSLAMHPDHELETFMDDLIETIASAQEDDGYLYAARTVDPDNPAPGAGTERWIHLQGSHELYNVGHMYEAAVAYHKTTGKRRFLDIAIKNAELVNSVFGPEARHDRPGHQEIEIGLAKLFRATQNRNYLKLAKFLLDQRGLEHASEPYPEDSVYAIYNGREYMQDHLPVLEQTSAVGHAVRASYMYAGMADVAALSGDPEYIKAIERIWQDVVATKLYLTGGIGARHTSEAFGDEYELPNKEAYTETCASIGNVFWNHRMFLLSGDARYIDVMERTLYNGLISGVSLDGNRFFYQNPLESDGGVERSEWFEVSCCPVNVLRFLPSLPGYIYAQTADTLFVNLFVQSKTYVDIDQTRIELSQRTEYPWNGQIKITVDPDQEKEFTLALRIPGWARGKPLPSDLYHYSNSSEDGYQIKVNDTNLDQKLENGFVRIRRAWRPGDKVDLMVSMPVRKVLSNEKIIENMGKIALERGPLVYCLEGIDNGGNILDLRIDESLKFETQYEPALLGGVVFLTGTAKRAEETINIKLIPYYAWAHRGAGEMTVWITK